MTFGEVDKIDHKEYPERLKSLSFQALLYIIDDANAAIRAMPEGRKAGYYADEINYAANEIHRRRKGL